jgi:hypothetical protein
LISICFNATLKAMTFRAAKNERLALHQHWDREIEQRVKEILSGAENGIPAKTVIKQARRVVNEIRRISSRQHHRAD